MAFDGIVENKLESLEGSGAIHTPPSIHKHGKVASPKESLVPLIDYPVGQHNRMILRHSFWCADTILDIVIVIDIDIGIDIDIVIVINVDTDIDIYGDII